MTMHSGSDSRPRRSWISKGLVLLALAALGPACPGYSAPGGPSGPPGTMTLFSDGFFPFPDANWTTPTIANSATFSTPLESSGYALAIAAPSTRTAAPTFLTRSDTNASGGVSFNSHLLTISIDIATNVQGTLADQGSVVIESSPAHTVLARADLDALTLVLTTQIGAATPVTTTLTAGTFYQLKFKVDASDMATWTVGAGMPSAGVAFAPTMVDLALTGNWMVGTPAANPVFLFMNALVTTP
jgi:hypothetical protein